MSATDQPDRPVLRVIRGDATPEEIAALLAVVSARTGGASRATGAARQLSGWADRSTTLRLPLQAGPGAWRASALPR